MVTLSHGIENRAKRQGCQRLLPVTLRGTLVGRNHFTFTTVMPQRDRLSALHDVVTTKVEIPFVVSPDVLCGIELADA